MAELSLRLDKIADMIKPCEVAADIGCDHGLLSAYMIKSGKARKVIAADIGKGPLERCRELVRRENLTDIDTRLSDGFAEINANDKVECSVIAGMGGPLGLILLYNGREVVSLMQQVVLGLQSDFPMCLYTLGKWGFESERTELVKDDGKFYYLLSLIPPKDFKNLYIDDIEDYMKKNKEELLNLPVAEAVKFYYPLPNDKDDATYADYLQNTRKRLKNIADKIECNSDISGITRLDEVKRELSMLDMLI